MDIKSIAVENFRSHASYELPLHQVTILTGPNGSGKSSLLEAAATCLIGENSWTERDGVRLPALIKKGEKQARVTVVGKRAITRIITGSGSKLVLDGKQPLTQFELLENLKVSHLEVKAALIPQAFLTLTVKEQKDVLYALMGRRVTLEKISKYIPEEAAKVWKKIVDSWNESHEDQTYVNLDKLYQFAFDSRRDYKSSALPTLKADPAQESRAKRLSEISQKIASANFENENLKARRLEVARIPQLEKELKALEAKIADVSIEAKWRTAQEEEIENSKKAAVAAAAVSEAKRSLAALKEITPGQGKKVTCPIGLECPHDENSLKAKKNLASGTMVSKEGEMKGFKAKEKEAHDRAAALEHKVYESRHSEKEIERLRAEYLKIEKIKVGLEDAKEVDVEALKTEKAELERQLGAAKPKPVEQDKTIDYLDQIVAALDVNGIKTKLIQKGIGELEDEANAVLKKFGGGQITFFMDSEYRPTILHKGTECSTGELSEGERLNVSLILQDVFARWSDVNLVCIDNVDLLDQEAYEKFVNIALRLKSKVLIGLANQAHAKVAGGDVVVLKAGEKKSGK